MSLFGVDKNRKLTIAALDGNTIAVQSLLDQGADINYKGKDGWTPLIRATFSRDIDTIRFLLEKGADVNEMGDNGDTALMFAVMDDNIEVVRLLMDAGADVNAKDDKGNTALMSVTAHGDIDIVKTLLEAGAAAGEATGYTVVQNHTEEVELFKKVADIDEKTLRDLKTALDNPVLDW